MCGIFGIICNDYSYSVAGLIYPGLMALQHRGQIFSGLATTSCNGKITSYKNRGLVSKVLNPKQLKIFSGNVGIGHVCYGGPKIRSAEQSQPHHFKTEQCNFALSFNGSITNQGEIKEKLKQIGKIFVTDTDVELIATLIESIIKFSDNMLEALKLMMKMLEGSYCIILMEPDGTLYAIRDPHGYKPLCIGTLNLNDKFFNIISSESCAFDSIDGKFDRDVRPGEIIKLSIVEGVEQQQVVNSKQGRLCQFEFIYHSRPDSIIDGISVAQVRYDLGRILARADTFTSNHAIVVPVPDSGRSAAMGYSWESKIPYDEGLLKNRYVWQLAANMDIKLNPIKTVVKDKDVILIDDSILSGETLKKIILKLRSAGARSIHVRISCPPIINKCDVNDDLLNRDYLIALQKKLKNYNAFDESMREYIGADSLKYQTIEGLKEAIGYKNTGLCLGCLTEYCLIKENGIHAELNLMI